MGYLFIAILIVFFGVTILNKLNRIEQQLTGTKKITLEKNQNQIEYDEPLLRDEVRQLLLEGKKIKAVKRVRERTGISLVEAKQYVDQFEL
ncbi:ribosomal protein L7/L12 [Neobacillus mesonae]|uniref:ribosomal protein L7/L12 n=2 Tax=Neobacillus mesonae TaxID=1193713 RepID=UPI0008368848|nr:ribosomal protein L7/L12 [Neobacillus mesonae]MED4205714.1 ribosomal protein L7/L12 [Neobacillus mesonae]